jgi:hypothetical protein
MRHGFPVFSSNMGIYSNHKGDPYEISERVGMLATCDKVFENSCGIPPDNPGVVNV